jgi:hypothetical protein
MSFRGVQVFATFAEWIRSAEARLRFPFGAFLGWLGLVIGILSGAVALVETFTSNTTIKEWVLSSTLVAVALLSLGALAYREYTLARQSKFVSTLAHQQQASGLLRDLRIFLQLHEKPPLLTAQALRQARGMIEEILTIYAEIFSLLTSTRCRTCIKLTDVHSEIPDNVLVFALARDKLSANENRLHDKDRADNSRDKLKDNSDFLRLWDPKLQEGVNFFCNNLPKEEGYETSSFNYWLNIAGNPNKIRKATWPLWYRSTIVWPIRRYPKEDLGIETHICLGFLCVDSHLTGVFELDEHGPVGTMLANALFPILELYTDLSAMLATTAQQGAGS